MRITQKLLVEVRRSRSMLQKLVQALSPTLVVRHEANCDDEGSWLCSSFDLHSGLTVVEVPAERLPAGFADTMPFWKPGMHVPTQA
jgi:hypothetical protein